ncbi:MAG: helix-hairpin-helix domain-containing protein [Paludibacteraceae bacterium]|nr:helix-hairpin-helix domain-containing protein [Paludibacteraceae bacterium]
MSKQQWIGLVIVLLMVTAVETCVYLTRKWQAAHPAPELFALQPEREQAFLSYLDSLDESERAARRAQYASRYPQPVIRLQPFDPNTADSTLLVTVGFKPWMSSNLIRYRNAGKVFRRPEDLQRLYGMTDSLYSTLLPFIQIDTAALAGSFGIGSIISDTDTVITAYTPRIKRDTILDLNTADTTEFMLLRGVGRFTAMQIIRYRQALGGYYSTSQLYEISEIANDRIDSLLPHLYADTSLITPIDVNRASVKQLYRHPYISYKQAEQLYDLRRRKLRLHSPDELSAVFSPDERQRLLPYLRFDGK